MPVSPDIAQKPKVPAPLAMALRPTVQPDTDEDGNLILSRTEANPLAGSTLDPNMPAAEPANHLAAGQASLPPVSTLGATPDTTPSLAPQGSKNPILHAIERGVGLVGEQPKPGQFYTGPITAGEKMGRIARLISGIGAGMAVAGGTPEEKQIGARVPELMLERQMMPVKVAQTRAMTDYYLGRNPTSVANTQANINSRENIAQGKLGIADINSHINAMKNGQVIENGSVRSMTPEEIAQNPLAQAGLSYKQAQTQVAQLNGQLAQARADSERSKSSPQGAVFLQKQRQIEAQLAMAQRRLSDSEIGLNQRQREFGINYYGIDPATGAPPPGTLMGENGEAVGNKFAQNVRPTTAARGRAEQAAAIKTVGTDFINRYLDPQSKQYAQFGPFLGRVGGLTALAGNPDPKFAEPRAALLSWIALHPAAHGFRGLRAVEEFERAFGNPAWTPQSLKASITGSFGTMEGLQDIGTPRTFSGGGAPASRPSNVPGPINKTLRPPGW